MKQAIRFFNEANEFVNEGPWPVKGKLGGVSQEAKLLEKAFKAAGVKVFKVKEYGSRGANYFVDVQAKGGKTTISIEVNQVSNVVFMHSQGRDLKLGELKENPRELIKVLKVLKNQPGFGQSKLVKKESVNEAGGVVTARIQQKPKGYWAVFNKKGQSQFEGNKKFMINIFKKASTLSPNAIGSILDRARPGDKHLEFKAQFSRYYFNESVDESGILYRAGVKKYGKEGMRKIQQAAGKRKSHAEIGAIKDKYEKDKKESVKEMNFAKKAISKWNKLAVTGRKLPPKLLIRGRWYAWEEGDKKSVFVSDKYGKEYEFDYSDVEQMEESVNEAIKPQGYSQLNTMVKHATIYLRDLSKALRKQDDNAVLREVHFLAAQFTTMEKMMKDKKWNAKYNESVNESSYHTRQITDFIKKNKDSEYTPTIQVKGSKSKTNYLNISFEALEQLAKIMMKESVNEAVVASMRTRSGQRDLEKKGGKLTMKMPNGEVLKFKDGADVKEYMDRVHGYWSFIKGYGKVKGLRESTAAYEKALQKIAKDKQMSMLSKKDRETLLKVAKLMKSANEACGPAEDEKMDEKVAMPLGQHLEAATKELDYMIKVGPIEDAYDSPKASIKVIRMARKLLDKVN